ncbi:MAG TPA: hypothetical protein VHO66_10470 [Ruminiclostridium sp.]|nr:hypothetical protein [Ruminiclostridium sp.]
MGQLKKITLKKSPFSKFTRGQAEKKLNQYKITAGSEVGSKNNYFYSELCSPAKYAHLKGCTQEISKQSCLAGLKVHISTTQHNYLLDHVFGKDCLVPATMIMELFAESATWFLEKLCKNNENNLKLTCFEELDIERAIALEPGDTIDIEILLMDLVCNETDARLKIDIVSKRKNFKGKVVGERLNAKCIVDFAAIIENQEENFVPNGNFDYYEIPKELYYKNFFHPLGPSFNSATGRFAVSADKDIIVGEYNCLDKEKGFIRGQNSEFLISPLGYDACVQNTVFLSVLNTFIGKLPVGCRKFQVFKKHLSTGNYRVVVRRKAIDEETMTADFYSLDSEGKTVLKAEGFVVRNSSFQNYRDKDNFERILNEYRKEKF